MSNSDKSREEIARENYKGIVVVFDNTLQLPEIKMFLNNPDSDEVDKKDAAEYTNLQQSKTYGIQAPLVKVNEFTIPFNDVLEMDLTCKKIPQVNLVIRDRLDLVKTFDKPNAEHGKLQIQILPPFEDAYKKVNLTFYIQNTEIDGDEISIKAIYDIPGWHDNKMKAYGQVTTYEFFESVAKEHKLGFATNVTATDDKRWIYVPNTKIASILTQECSFGGDREVLLDWWIDYWNNLNLVDVRERNETIESIEDMQTWILASRYPKTETEEVSEPFRCEAMVTNNETFRDMQVYISDYQIQSSGAANLGGTDRVIEYYKNEDLLTESFCLQNKDIVDSVYLKYDYVGENFGEHQYLLQSECRSAYLRKINAQKLSVDLYMPSLAFSRGTKLNFYWYKTNDMTNLTEMSDLESNIQLPESTGVEVGDPDKADLSDNFIIDKQISGQYYIETSDFYYDYGDGAYDWRHHLVLTRPSDQEERFNWNDIATEGNLQP